MKKLVILAVFGLSLLITGCGADPRDAADARRTDAITAQDVADREQAREIQLLAQQARAERWSRIADALTAGMVFGGSFAAAMVVISAGIGIGWALIGIGRAVSDAVIFRSTWVPLDKTTRQYPLLRQWITGDGRRLLSFGKGIWMLSNPNDGSVTAFDERREGDKQKIAGMISAWDVGLVAAAAKSARDSSSEGVSVIAPAAAQIITANSKYLEASDGTK